MKYLKILEAQGKIEFLQAGAARYVRRCSRMPASILRDYVSDPVLLFNSELILVESNPQGTPFRKRIGQGFGDVPDDDLLTDHVRDLLEDACDGVRSSAQQSIIVNNRVIEAEFEAVPIVFDDGSQGAGLRIVVIPDAGAGGLSSDTHDFTEEFFSEHAPFFLRLSPDLSVVSMNTAYARHTGSDQAETPPDFVARYSHDEFQSVVSRIETITEDTPAIELDLKRVTPDGKLAFEHWNIKGVFSETGTPIQYLAAGIETTRIRRIEQDLIMAINQLETMMELRTAEFQTITKELHQEIRRRTKAEKELALSRYAVEKAYDLIFFLDAEETIFFANIRARDLAETSTSPLVGRKISEVITLVSDTPENPGYNHAGSFLQTCPRTCEGLLHGQGDKLLPVEITISRIDIQDGGFFCVIAHDISERKRIEGILRRSEEQFRLLAENSGDLIWLMDTTTEQFLFVSPSSETVIGYSPDEILNLSWSDLLPDDEYRIARSRLSNRLANLIAGDTTCRVSRDQIKMIRKNGSIACIETASTLLHDKNSDSPLMLEISRDISLQDQIRKERDYIQKISFWPRF